MSSQRECRYLREMYVGEGVPTAVSIAPTPSGPWYPVNDVDEESRLRSMLGKVISRSGYECISEINRTAPQVTHPCPACEAAARELADLRARLTRAARLLDVVAESQIFVQPEFEQARALLADERSE